MFFFLTSTRPPLSLSLHLSTHRRFGTPSYTGKVAAFDLVRVLCVCVKREAGVAGGRRRPRRSLTVSPPFSLPSPQDGTLLLFLAPQHPRLGPQDENDWRFFNAAVPERMQALVEEGYEICVLE